MRLVDEMRPINKGLAFVYWSLLLTYLGQRIFIIIIFTTNEVTCRRVARLLTLPAG